MQPRLVIEGSNAALPFPPGQTEVVIGREDPVSDVFPEINLEEHGGDEGGVSRRHARITIQGGQCFIEDLDSTNHTYVNKQKLLPGQRQTLNNGDQLRFGRVKAIFCTN
jgi:pSer/pThr/pTyr-binding forkhead associated (FHA) protein